MYVTRRLLRATVEDAQGGTRPLEPESTPTASAATSSSVSPKKRRPLAKTQKANESTSLTPRRTTMKENDGHQNGRIQWSGLGLLVDAMDTQNRWCEAKIIDLNPSAKTVYIHYVGWNNRYDCWISSKQLAAHGHHTGGVKKTKQSWNGKTLLFVDLLATTTNKNDKTRKVALTSDKEVTLRPPTASSLRKRRQRESTSIPVVDVNVSEKHTKKARKSSPIASSVQIEVNTVDEETDRRSRRRQKGNVDMELELDIHDVPATLNETRPSPNNNKKVVKSKKPLLSESKSESNSNKRTRTNHGGASESKTVQPSESKPEGISNKRTKTSASRSASTTVSPRLSIETTPSTAPKPKEKKSKDKSKRKSSPHTSPVEEEMKKKQKKKTSPQPIAIDSEETTLVSISSTEPVSVMVRRSARSNLKSRKGKTRDKEEGDSDEEYTVDGNDDEDDDDDEEEEEDEQVEGVDGSKRMRGGATTIRSSPMNHETRQKLAAIFRMRLEKQHLTPRNNNFQHQPTSTHKKNLKTNRKTLKDEEEDDEEEEEAGMSEAESALQAYYHQQQQMQAYQYQQYYYHQAMIAAQQQQVDDELVAAAAMVESSGSSPEASMMENGRIIQARMEALEQQRRVQAYYQHHLQARERNLQLLASSQDILEKSGTTWKEQLQEKEIVEKEQTKQSDRVAEVAKLLVERVAIENEIIKAHTSPPMEKEQVQVEEEEEEKHVQDSPESETVLYEFVL